jgi:uncharacterized protein
MRRKVSLLLCGTIFFICLLAEKSFAQQDISPEKKALIKELLIATEAEKNTSRVMDSMLSTLETQYPLIIKQIEESLSAGLTPAQRGKIKAEVPDFTAFSRTFRQRIQQRINFGEFIEQISYPLYDKHFTEAELKDLITFYKSPTGKKTLSVMPELLSDSVQKSGEILIPKLSILVQEIIEEEVTRMKNKK